METCVANIGPAGRRRRLRQGIASLALAVILAVAVVGAPVAVRATVVLPLFGAALGFFQFREKT
ncbi:MAG TPA: hypothetical protein VGB42_09790 [Candidatus Thermoplasmatota archaeon]